MSIPLPGIFMPSRRKRNLFLHQPFQLRRNHFTAVIPTKDGSFLLCHPDEGGIS
jgi:hypothetical protein